MKYNGYKLPAGQSNAVTHTGQFCSPAAPYADIKSPDYRSWRQQRLASRLSKISGHAAARWNHLITVVVGAGDAQGIDALPSTLGSLLAQHYRNIEVLLVGIPNVRLGDTSDFANCRGLFSEPDVDALDFLSDPATDALWRGSHCVLTDAGTEFDPDALDLLNAALDNLPDTTAPTLVLCEESPPADDAEDNPPTELSGRHVDVLRSLDKRGTAFMVSRTLLQLARRSQRRPTSLQDWLGGISTMTPAPHIVHIAETLIHAPPGPRLSSRSAPGDAP